MSNEIAKNLEAFSRGIEDHNRRNPGHNVWGIGLNIIDIERLGLEVGENIIPGIILEEDNGIEGAFRILCDGDHNDGVMIDHTVTEAIGEYV